MIPFPQIDPVAINLLGLPVRWYGLAYVAGFLLGFQYLKHLIKSGKSRITVDHLDGLFVYIIAGVILGGRLGYAFLYQPEHYLSHPQDILKTWEGGMAFHGGLIGVTIAMLIFAWRHKLHPAHIADSLAPAFPIGLFFGRIANFINAELWGKPTDASWAMIFPTDPAQLPRHPSQLYEAALEGILIFIIMHIIAKRSYKQWRLTGTFLTGYALSRIVVEFFRAPDYNLTTGIYEYISQGQLLSLPMLALGLFLLVKQKKPA